MYTLFLRQRKLILIWGILLLLFAWVSNNYLPSGRNLFIIKYLGSAMIIIYGGTSFGYMLKDDSENLHFPYFMAYCLMLIASGVFLLFFLGNRYSLHYEYLITMRYFLIIQTCSFVVYCVSFLKNLNQQQSIVLALITLFIFINAFVMMRTSSMLSPSFNYLLLPALSQMIVYLILDRNNKQATEKENL